MLDEEPPRRIRWSPHAVGNLHLRHLTPEDVERTLRQPDATAPGRLPDRTIFMRRYHDILLDKPMLLLVAVEDTPTERVILTVFSTSRPNRYLRGAQ